MADQVLSSVTNFALGISIARETSTEGFGAYAIAFATYLVFVVIGRAITAQPMMIRYSGTERATWAHGASQSATTALALGIVGGMLCALVGAALGGEIGMAVLGIGLGLPGLLLQDLWRFAFFSAGRGRDAFLNDALWGAVLVPVLVVITALGPDSAHWFIIGWAGAATIAAGAGFLQARVGVNVRAVQEWLSANRDLIPQLAGGSLIRAGVEPLSYYAMAGLAGLPAVGAIRGAALLLGPVNIVYQGAQLIAVPEAVRALRRSTAALSRWSARFGAGMSLVAALYGAVFLLIPDPVGGALLGDSWLPSQAVVLPMTISLAAMMVSAGAGSGLLALGETNRTLRVAAISSVVTVGAVVVGTGIGAATGAALGFATGSCSAALAAWRELIAAVEPPPDRAG